MIWIKVHYLLFQLSQMFRSIYSSIKAEEMQQKGAEAAAAMQQDITKHASFCCLLQVFIHLIYFKTTFVRIAPATNWSVCFLLVPQQGQQGPVTVQVQKWIEVFVRKSFLKKFTEVSLQILILTSDLLNYNQLYI